MTINKNSRQMPKLKSIVSSKEYCDLLYAWLQCNSEKVGVGAENPGRRIAKSAVNWSAIERDFTRTYEDGSTEKVMGRKTAKKYFDFLIEEELITYNEEDKYYYLTVLSSESGHLIEYETLIKMMNVLQKHSISIYIYLFNRYYACGCQPFIATKSQIKEYIGFTVNSNNNDGVILDSIEFLMRLGLLSMKHIQKEGKTYLQFEWVKNQLPKL